MRSRTVVTLALVMLGLTGCGTTEPEVSREILWVSGNWISTETFHMGSAPGWGEEYFHVSIDPVTNPFLLTGSWRLSNSTKGIISNGGLTGSSISLSLRYCTSSCQPDGATMNGTLHISQTSNHSSDYITGILNGHLSVYGHWTSEEITFHRGG